MLRNIVFAMLLMSLSLTLTAQKLNLTRSVLVVSENIDQPVRDALIETLTEEVAKRTSVQLPLQKRMGATTIVLASIRDVEIDGIRVPLRDDKQLPEYQPEGYRIVAETTTSGTRLWLIGADNRGILYAMGHFLRNARLTRRNIEFTLTEELATAPQYPLRGHQLGYRNTANSWDAWTVEQFDQYIRELALFGANSVENIPFQDGAPGPLMKYDRDFMNVKMSEICDRYDQDYWVWTPATSDLGDSDYVAEQLARHKALYESCPRLDGIFFPGGDPGHNHPNLVMPFLKQVAELLSQYHPKAGVWISLQGFSAEQIDYFFQYLDEHQPEWLAGVVSGPSSPDMAQMRFRLPSKYMHRHYADITHTIRCQYPTQDWDQAYALTQGREVTNPQPFYYAAIHNRYAPFTDGFLTYSDGVHDDINKVVWNLVGWDSNKDVFEILTEYARFFFGTEVADAAANGILALERNWAGPIEANGGIEATLAFWQNLESKHPELRQNWRWQFLVMRAYYDTYNRRRKIYEQNLEKEANQILAKARVNGVDRTLAEALAHINKADENRISPELREKVVAYCEALFQSVGLQTSVDKYHASGAERGAILDFLDYPLNNRWWLADEFDKIRKMESEEAQLERIEVIRTWDQPGLGSFYDNISDISKGPRVQTSKYDATDVAWWNNGMSRARLSTQLFQNFPRIEYEDLDPNARYLIRIAGYGEALLRVDGVRLSPVKYDKELEGFKEFIVPQRFISDGSLVVTFDEPEESHLNWRQHSKVSDIWLIKR